MLHPMQTTAQLPPDTAPETIDDDALLREAFTRVYDLIDSKMANSRYKSLALTGLEIAQMWAMKALHHR